MTTGHLDWVVFSGAVVESRLTDGCLADLAWVRKRAGGRAELAFEGAVEGGLGLIPDVARDFGHALGRGR